MKTRGFCYTAFSEEPPKLDGYQYHLYGREVCPETGRKHLQGYVFFKSARALSSVIKLLKPHHVEPCKGSPQDNIAYCKKGGDWIEDGVAPIKGRRTDLEELYAQAKAKRKFKDVIEDNPNFIRYEPYFKRMKDLNSDYDSYVKKEVYIYWGATGTGKTRKAYADYPGLYRVSSYKWFDGYDGEETVLFDEFRPDNMHFHQLLELTDGYGIRKEVKGGFTYFNPKVILFTSNDDPRRWYTDTDMAPFFRRVTKIHHFN